MEGWVPFKRISITDERTLSYGIGLHNHFIVKPSAEEPHEMPKGPDLKNLKNVVPGADGPRA